MEIKNLSLIYPKVYISKSRFGKGLFAAKNIIKNQVILNFTGKVITFNEVLAKGEQEANALQIDTMEYIDLQEPGVFGNHSCNPNAGIVNSNILIALNDIAQDEEIFYDYSTTMSEKLWTMKCSCGSSICRGVVKDFHYLPTDIKAKYLNLGIVQKFIVREHDALLVKID
ncbi:SET domain-containing protein-lysine N-methyltransferase [Nodularia spumigena CS-591/04]|uniref:SET domain-containing protein n=2 Tax=Nodularia spumigena TaxID=70799 RepID=UPI00232CDF43|nr:SET domain-containing protein-lysine N-methyltransferase [Nodularia spumigena]MDB9320511.1 SET domain-containing protein-lysine N-methyltransferase [Nodularia spumigena CS-591/07A]MDB9332371.1 SET domain-containing protein-lysine N-methyltransferase [Nodularia spumigena CS-591/04]MDB9348073.1 SET domain-containing protein-lysine N-methyltransferase [Nodularia spumigena CS-588/01]MDB9352836.1 SET domain-containing protein-lysine N-methyltransferase [Nodularia spumigena CS-588/05]MDB9359278.1